jgi:cytoskeletal protein RodZ
VTPNESPKPKSKLQKSRSSNSSLGQILSGRRKELNLSLEDIERDTHIRVKYLRLIEAGDYKSLPDDVYSRGYVKNYADQLGFDTNQILKVYSTERLKDTQTLAKPSASKVKRGIKPIDSQTYVITPRTILAGLTSLFVLIMVGYVGLQLSQLSVPPVINLANQDKSSTNTSVIIVSGEVDSGSDVFINDSPILSSPDGSFSDRVMLVDGSNQIKISARNKFGKESSKTIIVDAKIEGSKLALPTDVRPASFDGVDLQVYITTQASFITVKVDGKDAFKGTMLPGAKQLFQAKESVRISTSNAASTNVVVTNSKVAGKDIGQIGSEAEPKQDILFAKDTNIQ